jgi:transposase-like protein
MGREAGNFMYGRNFPTLPPPDTKRWVPKRKAEVVAAVEEGVLSLEEACRLYSLSSEEFLSWKEALERYGLAGLRRANARSYSEPKRARSDISAPYMEARI